MACPTLIPAVQPRAGRLTEGVLLQVLRDLLDARLTGVLHLRHLDRRLTLRLVNGQIVSGSSGVAERLGEILVRCGLLGRSDLERALVQARRQGRRLGPVLCELGLVRRDRLEEALGLQIRDVLSTALAWRGGTYAFEPDEVPTPMAEDVTLRVSTEQLLLEAANRIGTEAAREALGTLQAVPPPPALPDDRSPVAELRQQIQKAFEGLRGKSHFEVLGVSRQAGPDEIKAAYLGLAKRFHPDALRDPALADVGSAATAVFQRLTDAYNVLRSARRVGCEKRVGGPPPAPVPLPAASKPADVAAAPAAPEPPPPRPLDELLREGEENLVQGRLWEASVALEEVLGRSEGRLRQRAHLLLARAYAKSRSGSKRAEAELMNLLAEDGRCTEAHLALARLYREKGLTERAVAAFRTVLSLEPRHAQAAQELAALVPSARPGRRLLDRFLPRAH